MADPRPLRRRAALAAGLLATAATATAAGVQHQAETPAADRLLCDLARAIAAAEAAADAAALAADGAEAEAAAHDQVAQLVAMAAATPAAGPLGLASKSAILARAAAGGFTPAERDLAASLGADAARLFPSLATAPSDDATTMRARHPDADLIAACAEHIENIKALNEDESDFGGDDSPLWLACTRTHDAVAAARPQTLAGLVAKAGAAKAVARQPNGDEAPENCSAAVWAWHLVNDLLRLGGRA
ncbi:hypothetical protein [Pseudoroseomonas cervicalis]|uniref:hypothetical protein n=1 Tax=Teichococcus cervicalis TaxID=204525 RepID=UPI0022F153E9|nr:hypothetical protein [Pseudoroseomonas cervicalis]WBV44025.1 hypothetical protein PFY06_05510 [Pseudoroseomonas cervicalis]